MRARYYVVGLTLVALSLPIRSVAEQQPVDTFRSGREVLSVSASVHDGAGRPLTDLQASDFTVRVDGELRPVLTARQFGTDGGRMTNDAVPIPRFLRSSDAPPGRLVVFAIDRDSIRGGSEKPVIETAARMLDALSPADAVGAIGLPVGGVELTRDHSAVADAIRKMTGTAPDPGWQHAMSWEEALAYERQDALTIARVVERECPKIRRGDLDPPDDCPPALRRQAREMLIVGRGQAQTLLTRLMDLIGRLGTLRAPKNLILISGGVPFDLELVSRYRDLADKAAQAHVAMFVVNLDQPSFDASDRGHFASVFGGREYTTGLGNIAGVTGGTLFHGVGRATGAFDRIVSDINYFYELGVESRASDANGRPHRLEVNVNRSGAHVRAPAETATAPQSRRGADEIIATSLAEPTDVAELPLEVATYVTHSSDAGKVRVMISAAVSERFAPTQWGYLIIDSGKIIGGGRDPIEPSTGQRWSTTATVDVPPGRYRLRTAIADAEGRVGTLDLPLTAGLRMAGSVQASDLIVGAVADGRLLPRAQVRQGEPGVAMIELSSGETLAGTTGVFQLTRAGTADPALTLPLELRPREQDKSVVIAEALLDWSSLAGGTYTASAVFSRAGAPFARVSRIVEVVPGVATASGPLARSVGVPSGRNASTPRDAELGDALELVGRYVSDYGQQASLIIGVERYEQRYDNAPLGQPSGRRLTSEFALVKTAGVGWAGFRDVIELNGKPIPDRQDRLQTLFKASTPDVSEARRIADESARFNIGPTRRNFNEPTAALFFLTPATQVRFAFTRKGQTSLDGTAVWEIDFEEKTKPTLIRTTDGRDIASHGTIWVAKSDGTVVRTKMVITGFAGAGSSSTIDVLYARDARLGLWLPAKMTERHTGAIRQMSTSRRASSAVIEGVVTATAVYSDFKRFETAAAIK